MLTKLVAIPPLAALASARLVYLGSSSYGGPGDDLDRMTIYGVNGPHNVLTFDARADGSFALVDTFQSSDKEGANWLPGSASFSFKGISCHMESNLKLLKQDGYPLRFTFTPVSAPPQRFVPYYHQVGAVTCDHRANVDGVVLICDGGIVCKDP